MYDNKSFSLKQKSALAIEVDKEFSQHCDTSEKQFTLLNESDKDYIEEVFKRMCFLRILISANTQFWKGVYRLNNPETGEVQRKKSLQIEGFHPRKVCFKF